MRPLNSVLSENWRKKLGFECRISGRLEPIPRLTETQEGELTVAYLAVVNEPIAVTGQDDAAKAEWWPISDLPHLAFDHYDIMQDVIRIYKEIVV
jgi:ADP-ribose pyrophosphatase YjhB (NUDIX family)